MADGAPKEDRRSISPAIPDRRRGGARNLLLKGHGVGRAGASAAFNIDNEFRRDVTEIARMIKLKTMCTVHINGDLEIVNLICGDHFAYYGEAAGVSLKYFRAPPPHEADVVIANAYPFDASFTIMRKAYTPLNLAPEEATKIIIASNYGGIGTHGLFQHINPSRFQPYITRYRQISIMKPKQIAAKIWKRVKRRPRAREMSSHRPSGGNARRSPYLLPSNTKRLIVYRPDRAAPQVGEIPGMVMTDSWERVLDLIASDHPTKKVLKVALYSCAGLQCVPPTSER